MLYTLSLHDALPILAEPLSVRGGAAAQGHRVLDVEPLELVLVDHRGRRVEAIQVELRNQPGQARAAGAWREWAGA